MSSNAAEVHAWNMGSAKAYEDRQKSAEERNAVRRELGSVRKELVRARTLMDPVPALVPPSQDLPSRSLRPPLRLLSHALLPRHIVRPRNHTDDTPQPSYVSELV